MSDRRYPLSLKKSSSLGLDIAPIFQEDTLFDRPGTSCRLVDENSDRGCNVMSMSSQSEIFSEGKYQQEKKAVLHAMASKLFCTSDDENGTLRSDDRPITCFTCGKDISKWNLRRRTVHANACLEKHKKIDAKTKITKRKTLNSGIKSRPTKAAGVNEITSSSSLSSKRVWEEEEQDDSFVRDFIAIKPSPQNFVSRIPEKKGERKKEVEEIRNAEARFLQNCQSDESDEDLAKALKHSLLGFTTPVTMVVEEGLASDFANHANQLEVISRNEDKDRHYSSYVAEEEKREECAEVKTRPTSVHHYDEDCMDYVLDSVLQDDDNVQSTQQFPDSALRTSRLAMSSVLPGNGMWSASASTVALKNVIKPKNQDIELRIRHFVSSQVSIPKVFFDPPASSEEQFNEEISSTEKANQPQCLAGSVREIISLEDNDESENEADVEVHHCATKSSLENGTEACESGSSDTIDDLGDSECVKIISPAAKSVQCIADSQEVRRGSGEISACIVSGNDDSEIEPIGKDSEKTFSSQQTRDMVQEILQAEYTVPSESLSLTPTLAIHDGDNFVYRVEFLSLGELMNSAPVCSSGSEVHLHKDGNGNDRNNHATRRDDALILKEDADRLMHVSSWEFSDSDIAPTLKMASDQEWNILHKSDGAIEDLSDEDEKLLEPKEDRIVNDQAKEEIEHQHEAYTHSVETAYASLQSSVELARAEFFKSVTIAAMGRDLALYDICKKSGFSLSRSMALDTTVLRRCRIFREAQGQHVLELEKPSAIQRGHSAFPEVLNYSSSGNVCEASPIMSNMVQSDSVKASPTAGHSDLHHQSFFQKSFPRNGDPCTLSCSKPAKRARIASSHRIQESESDEDFSADTFSPTSSFLNLAPAASRRVSRSPPLLQRESISVAQSPSFEDIAPSKAKKEAGHFSQAFTCSSRLEGEELSSKPGKSSRKKRPAQKRKRLPKTSPLEDRIESVTLDMKQDVDEVIMGYIQGNRELQEKILLYIEIEITQILVDMKRKDLKVGKKDLQSFFHKQNIIFRDMSKKW